MKKLYSPIKTAVVLIFAVMSFELTMEITSFAQRSRPISVERREEQLNRQIMDDARDDLDRELKGGKNKPSARISAQKLEQVKKDFEELQAGYNRIVIAMAEKQNLDFTAILKTITEINKSAARLKENLALPRPKPDEEKAAPQSEPESTEIKKSLLTLEKHIYSFATNPLFEKPDVLDLELAGKAGRDLDRIIELSEKIKKTGELPAQSDKH